VRSVAPERPPVRKAERAVKRLFDVAVAATGLAVAGPLLGALAALVRIDSRGPALYRNPRMGRDQRPFTMIKLRTMDDAGRVTRVGRLLRPTGLDELPQLWHVLTGEMSVVGPRPEVLDRVAGHVARLPHYPERHLMRPGITGWAQVNGLRGEASSIPCRLEHDLVYVRTWSLALDARILLGTPAAVWRDLRRAGK
jgi:lipopolysaccharide/colanic/teichoic acid biosynthesis glycosyltransferase